jgi:YesN/AraC family two-component response regulator
MPSILIVDDEPVFRRGLRAMIGAWDQDWTVAGDARDGVEALGLIEELQPDVMLTDIRMPRMDGLQLQRIAREKFPALQCIVVSGYEDFSYVQQSLRSGARDYMLKPVEREELYRVLGQIKEELKDVRASVQAEPDDHRLDRDPIALALQYMERRYSRPITLKDAADHVFLSPTYFSALFKQRTGKTFVEHLTSLRIEEAKRRITHTDDKMFHIAEDTGFANIRHFNRVFKSETGFAPREFREEARRGD